jgi:N-acetylglucosaminyldiphosphoundecaprenol N-acetyl-beta-D-mannosaminyltransferase
MSKVTLLGTPLMATTYGGLGDQCIEWARGPQCVALEFANTQIVTMRRHDPAFREMTRGYDHFAPDGMPLIWCMNRAGAGMKDRVYGPTFMREFLTRAPAGSTHYLLGGTEECGTRLREVFLKLNPGLRFVGSFHGRCGADGLLLDGADEKITAELNRLSPDFIWLCFGAPKQQTWMMRHKPLIRRGVMMTVGFAFDVNAGTKPDAPAWMQRLGLTWLFRICSEPRRLGPRYLKYNLLFLWYLLWDGLRGRVFTRETSPTGSTAGSIR